ncbi:MAG TPA: hypothetical protein VEL76_16360, partial [Gemmataceae bacterium]|nr:hypothetical protein [Gemmataceae bacterium]
MSDHNEVSITIRVPVGVGVSTRPNMALGFYDASITMRFPEDSESIPPGDLNTDGVVSPRASTVVGTAEELDTSGMPTGTNVDATNVLNS